MVGLRLRTWSKQNEDNKDMKIHRGHTPLHSHRVQWYKLHAVIPPDLARDSSTIFDTIPQSPNENSAFLAWKLLYFAQVSRCLISLPQIYLFFLKSFTGKFSVCSHMRTELRCAREVLLHRFWFGNLQKVLC